MSDGIPVIKTIRDGTGLFISWTVIVGTIVGTSLATGLYLDLKRDVDGHSKSLQEMHQTMHHINIKVDAVLIKEGLDPAKVVKERDGENLDP